ncbi:MAG: TIGR00730 family Rossman fold protein [Chloroherpetonaceae bacterium]|nr:TIGR00730 family Rossman fold protein [Chloroherpetonaceae bacterium]MCS7212446.1 TIGR00730 family Rossman fold protein [Chloroherpetonaceae bacterium]MDW8020681.1 TIGR00730 family Rossman fold protein [Chloroherpetonaceae bacterium]MDW8465511.1 TIGR00730 family Rossman fold protein [Chloroherpetonaceae bacterium]
MATAQPPKSICVYCGSRTGNSPAHRAAASALGTAIAQHGLRLVYGGGQLGLMGILADAALAQGGEVVGVIPEMLVRRESAHRGLTELIVVDSMHARKAKMVELSDAFIALSGGLGTLDELFEILTWAQLGFHQKPCGILNIDGYYDSLLAFLDHAVSEGFVKPSQRTALLVSSSVSELLAEILQPRIISTAVPKELL